MSALTLGGLTFDYDEQTGYLGISAGGDVLGVAEVPGETWEAFHSVAGAVEEATEDDTALAARVRGADVAILLSEKGRAGAAWFKGIGTVPMNLEVSYGEQDDPPQTIRHVTVRAGFKAQEWRKMDRSGLHQGGDDGAAD